MADDSGSKRRKPKLNKKGFPYREARLVHFGYDREKKWFIQFYVWDVAKKKLVRKRVGKDILAAIYDPEERQKEAYSQIAAINYELSQDGMVESYAKEKKEIPSHQFHGYTLLDGIRFVQHVKEEIEKRARGTIRQYKYLETVITDFLKSQGLDEKYLLRQVKPSFVDQFTRYVTLERKLSNKTFNGLVTSLHSSIECLREKDEKLFPKVNPVPVNKLPENSLTHAAYSMDQLTKLSEDISASDPQLLLFIRFIYFTLGRPNEIRLMKVGHIEIDLHRVKFSGENAKTNKEKFVGISPAFEKIIRESGILDYPAEYYVFNSCGHPAPSPSGLNFFSKALRPFIKKFKELNDRYTLYSFKHTGAIQLYLASKDIELIRKQCRHEDLSQTNTYLQQLGLFTDHQGLKDWKGF